MAGRTVISAMLQRYLSLAPLQGVALLVGLGWLIALNLQAYRYVVHQSQATRERIDAMWGVVTATAGQVGGVSRKQAVEYLHEQGQPLQRIDLTGAKLGGAALPGADLRMAILTNATLRKADLRDADLWRARLGGARLSGAVLRNARLHGAGLASARLDRAELHGSDLGAADLRGADLTGANLSGADLRGARVTAAQLARACADPASPPRLDAALRPPAPWPQPCPAR